MWAVWVLSLLGPLLLAFKKGERAFVAIIGYYGLFFWIVFGVAMDDSKFYSSAVLFGALGVFNTYYSLKLQERKKQREHDQAHFYARYVRRGTERLPRL